MGRRFGVSYEERLDAVEQYLRHDCSMNDLAKQLKVDEYYNNHRYQKRLNGMAPLEYRQYLLNIVA